MKTRFAAIVICTSLTAGALFFCDAVSLSAASVDGEISRETVEIFDGVVCTHVTLSESSKYGMQSFWVTEFDPQRDDLTLDVANKGMWLNSRVSTADTMKLIKEESQGAKTPISAVNGDLWTVSYAHSRVEGKEMSYGGYDDPVVKKVLELPRGLSIYNGEIVAGPHTRSETPFEGDFDCFGITADGRTVLGTPSLNIRIEKVSESETLQFNATGFNRLPANNAIMVYSDKGPSSDYCLDDAYEIYVDCDRDYCVKQGAVIRGKVTAVSKPGEVRLPMQDNRFIITARGAKQIGRIQRFNIGDEIEFEFSLTGSDGDNEIWQEVVNAVGGHMILVKDGKSTNIGDSTRYPASIIGNKSDGSVVFVTMDGRQPRYAVGFRISDMADILLAFGVENAFLLDGGGSADMVNIDPEGEYVVVNRPSDGKPRLVINSVVLSYVIDKTPTVSRESVTAFDRYGIKSDLATPENIGDYTDLGTLNADEFDSIEVCGWFACNELYGMIRGFGYSLDGGERIYDDSFSLNRISDKNAILKISQKSQGKSADHSGFKVKFPVNGGDHEIKIFAETSSGGEFPIWTLKYACKESEAPVVAGNNVLPLALAGFVLLSAVAVCSVIFAKKHKKCDKL